MAPHTHLREPKGGLMSHRQCLSARYNGRLSGESHAPSEAAEGAGPHNAS